MKAVVLAAGKSSRFYPYRDKHKSLSVILGKTIIEHTVESIRKSGINDIIIVVSAKSPIAELLRDGRNFGVKIRYVVQKNPTGGGNGLLVAAPYINTNEDFFLLNASHVDFWEFAKLMLDKKRKEDKAVLLAKKEEFLDRFGVLNVDKDKVLDLEEKPSMGKELSSLKIVGIYLFSGNFLKTLKETPSQHYRLEKAISKFAKKESVKFVETANDTVSLKYSWDLLSLKNYLMRSVKKSIDSKVKIAKNVQILGDVIIEEGAEIMEGAHIKGPCYIGRNATIGNNTLVRDFSDIENDCVIGAYMEIKNSLIMRKSKTHSGFIGDSIIGEDCRIGAEFSTANVRLDRKSVKVILGEKELDTGFKFLGTIVGKKTKIGIKVSTMPGIVIGQNSIVGPSTTVLHNVSDNTKYFTKFKEIVVRNE